MIKAVIFDLDDTLFSELQYVKSGFRAVAEKLSDSPRTCESYTDEMNALFKENALNVFDRFCLIHRDKNFSVSQAIADYRNHFPDIRPFDDVIPCLKSLHKNGLKLGLITDGRESTQKLKIEALQIRDYLDEIIITDALGGAVFRKPNPVSYEIICKRFEITFSQALYVGDNPAKDFLIGSRGLRTVRIIRNESLYAQNEYAQNAKETFTVESLKEIEEKIIPLCR